MNPNPLAALNHFTVPVSFISFSVSLFQLIVIPGGVHAGLGIELLDVFRGRSAEVTAGIKSYFDSSTKAAGFTSPFVRFFAFPGREEMRSTIRSREETRRFCTQTQCLR